MAPKKKPSSTAKASSSSTPTHFDKRHFWDTEGANIYTMLLNKSMYCERAVDMSLPDNEFIIRAKVRQWENSVQQPTDAVKSLVRKFYANLKVKHENYRVKLSGMMFPFDSETKNAVYGMPDYKAHGYETLKGGTVDYDEIMQYSCVPRAARKLNLEGKVVNFVSRYLRSVAYNWFVFIASRLIPSSHTSEVTKKE